MNLHSEISKILTDWTIQPKDKIIDQLLALIKKHEREVIGTGYPEHDGIPGAPNNQYIQGYNEAKNEMLAKLKEAT